MSPVRPTLQVVGRRLDPEHYELRDFLTRIAQPHEWYEAGSPMNLGDAGARVTMVVRGDRLGKTMSAYLVERIQAHPLIVADNGVRTDAAGFILTGLDLLEDGRRPDDWPLARDPLPMEMSVPGLFAAGDVRHGSTKRVAGAVGDGAMSVALAHRRLAELQQERSA